MNYLPNKDFALLIVRLIFGVRLIYGTIDNVLSWERMLEFSDFLAQNGFPFPTVCAVISVYVQFLAGFSWILGFQVRRFSVLMIINFLVAIFAVHVAHGDGYLQTAPAIHLLGISILLLAFGPGKYGIGGDSKPRP